MTDTSPETVQKLIARLRDLGDHARFEPSAHHDAADMLEAMLRERDGVIQEMVEEERHQEEMRELERQAMEDHFAKHPHG